MSDKPRKHSSNNIVALPGSFEQRIKEAWEDYALGNCAKALGKFLALIDDGCDDAYAFVGAFYERGCDGVEKDFEKARFYHERAIEIRGSVEAYLGLARIYYFGLGVSPDFFKAFQYYDTVAKETQSSGVAYLMLGRMYQNGEGTKRDLQKARDCYRKAWSKGYVTGLARLGVLEQECGNPFKGWLLRLQAGFLAYRIAKKDLHDPRLRSS